MKRWMIGCVFTALATVCLVPTSKGQNKEELQIFMRAKLKHSQNVLEGLVLGDYDKIVKGAQEMSLLSLAASWQVLQTPEYNDYSRKFRDATDNLSDVAKKKNLDAATVAYNRVTLRCVECHKYVRTILIAQQ